ncbi:MAG: D-alanyl-D-alanine carboxypeptidase [Candidatus Binatia bacterium]|nr:MAG: D-alanyl-D-alanine carboxypeptidase [Candidatus Binatia bacterium]
MLGLLLVASALASPARAEHALSAALAEGANPGAVFEHLGDGEVLYLVDAEGRPLLDVRSGEPFVPASTIKLFTCFLALEHFGPRHRFRTEFYLDGNELIVRGLGDPFLVTEEIEHIARELARRIPGREIAGLGIDDSYFASDLSIPGRGRSPNPYDAPVSATAVNFNSVAVRRKQGRVTSADPRTPLTASARELALRQKLRGAARISLGTRERALRHAGELLAAELRKAGVRVGNALDSAASAPSGKPLYVHANSRPLAEVCRSMLEFSNNFVANVLFLDVGASLYGPPASLEKARRAARSTIERHPELRGLRVWEGSGLSRENRATARALAALLELFSPYRHLLPRKNGVLAKTGTLRDTATLVGYLPSRTRGMLRFVLALDGSGSERRWRIVESLARTF